MKNVICLGNIISAKVIWGSRCNNDSVNSMLLFIPATPERALKMKLYTRADKHTHAIWKIHTYIILSTSLMKVECRGRCFTAARYSPSSSGGQEAKDTRSKRNCRESPGRQNPIPQIGTGPNAWSAPPHHCLIPYSKRANEEKWQASICIREALLALGRQLELEKIPNTWAIRAVHTARRRVQRGQDYRFGPQSSYIS